MIKSAYYQMEKERNLCIKPYSNMDGCNNLEDLSDEWVSFLTHHQRFFEKLRVGSKNNSSQPLAGQIIGERRGDDLLSYLMHARNAEEHTLELSSAGTERIEAIVPPKSSIHFRRSPDDIYKIQITNNSNREMPVSYFPQISVVEIPQRDGTKVSPPKTHMSVTLPSINPIFLTFTAIQYMDYALRKTAKFPSTA